MNLLMSRVIPAEWDGLMIKEILFDQFNFSKKSLRKIKVFKGIFLNGKPTFATNRVKKGDLLELYIPIENSEEIIPQPIPVLILYEDQDVVVINKPSGIVVHPTRNHYLGTIANGLAFHWQSQGKIYRFRPVHRLDKDTSGLFVVAKNQYSHHKLALQLINRSLKRLYHAIVHGNVKLDQGRIEASILKDPDHAVKRIIVSKETLNSKEAVTFYKVIERFADYTLVELELKTGRTHQIRVHMSELGHPLAGDELYGGTADSLMKRQALHAAKIEFFHPVTNQLFSFSAPYPDDMEQCIRHLRSNKDGKKI